MDKKDYKSSSDEETFEDANEKIVNDLIGDFSAGLKITELNEKHKRSGVDDDSASDSENERHIKESFVDCETSDLIDDESQLDSEKGQTEDEREAARAKAEELKKKGNELYKNNDYLKSAEVYTVALRTCPVLNRSERSVLYGNRAAAKQKLDLKSAAIDDCTKSIEFNPLYVKVLLRRAALYEETDKLDESMEDFKKVLEIDPENHEAQAAHVRLPPLINARNEKMKAEMVEKLKDLGNLVLRPFGLSTKNFELKQDPSTGSYSVNFNQNPQQ